jgi:hypothetical protein
MGEQIIKSHDVKIIEHLQMRSYSQVIDGSGGWLVDEGGPKVAGVSEDEQHRAEVPGDDQNSG